MTNIMYIMRGKLDSTVHNVPAEIDQEIAELKLKTMAIQIDQLTDEQQSYLSSEFLSS